MQGRAVVMPADLACDTLLPSRLNTQLCFGFALHWDGWRPSIYSAANWPTWTVPICDPISQALNLAAPHKLWTRYLLDQLVGNSPCALFAQRRGSRFGQ